MFDRFGKLDINLDFADSSFGSGNIQLASCRFGFANGQNNLCSIFNLLIGKRFEVVKGFTQAHKIEIIFVVLVLDAKG